jgi:aldose 1-epimerase
MKRVLFISKTLTICTLLIFTFCNKEARFNMDITSQPFGEIKNGTKVDLYTLTNDNGMTVKITNYGGIITSIIVPDKNGQFSDVALGYDRLEGYLEKTPYFGAIVGRYGNRIGNGQFVIDGTTYNLPKNNGPNALHGGLVGFDKVAWETKELKENGTVGLELKYTAADMEEGYPGQLDVTVTYTLTNDNELEINYTATTTKPTHVNLTNHSYFNLKDGGATPMLDHKITLNAHSITPVDKTLIPNGDLMPVEGTPFDFRRPFVIGERIDADFEQIRFGGGYDHNFVLNGQSGEMKTVATVAEETSGRVMEVFTTEPGVQFYTANFLDGSITGKNGHVYNKRHGFCLETQHFPDSPNKPNFPTTLLKPDEKYNTSTIFKFSVK